MQTRLLLFFFMFNLTAVNIFAQTDSSFMMPASDYQPAVTSSVSGFSTHKFNTVVRMGSQFSSARGYGSGFSTFIIPEISYGLTKRFSLSGGIGYINTTYTGVRPNFLSEEKVNDNFSMGLVYLSGRYLLNDRVIVTGSAYKMFDLSGNSLNHPYRNQEGQGFNLNVDYKIAEGVHLQAGFGYHEQASPFRSPASSLFSSDPFSNDFHPFP